MIDYAKALQEGFEAAQKANLARKEIKAVLEKFRDDILAGSGGKLLIEIKQFEEKVSPLDIMKRGALAQFEREVYFAITASNPTVEKPLYKELARWKQSRDGYPCSLIVNRQESQLEDRTALELGLAELLRDPRVGEKLYALVNQV